jgi:L-fucose mutarotase
MLKNVDPLLTPELLSVLASMGHGDDLVLVDEHFPADSIARSTIHGSPIRLAGIDCTRAARAILSVLPLDDTVPEPVHRMEVEGGPEELPEVQQEVQVELDRAEGRSVPMASVGRWDYYDVARSAYALVWTGELRVYGCFVFKKGFIRPE